MAGGKDPFGISDPAGMQTPTSPPGADSLTNECLSPPSFLPVYLFPSDGIVPLTEKYHRTLTSP